MKKRWYVTAGAVVATGVASLTINAGGSATPSKTIDATGLDKTPLNCPPGSHLVALFTISDIDNSGDVPLLINVTFTDGDGSSFPNFRFDSMGKAPGNPPWARYKGDVSPTGVSGASTQIYSSWQGQFVLEEYFCGNPTPPTTTTTSSSIPPTTTTTSSTVPPTTTVPTSAPASTTTTVPHAQPLIPTTTTVPQVQPQPVFVTG